MADTTENSERASSSEKTIHPGHATKHRSMLKDIILIATVTTAMILNTASSTAAAIGLPTIGRDLDIFESKLQWVTSAYALSSGCLLVFCGRLADLYGRKRAFVVGCAIMGAFALGSGFAQNEVTLDVLRGMQGIGGAAVIPASLGILAHTFPPSTIRSVAFATFAAGAPIGAALGNTVGAVLVQLTDQSWRSIFWFLAGLAAICCLGGIISIDPDIAHRELQDRRIDWLGAFLVTAGLTLVVFVLSDGSIAPNGWKTPYIIALLIVGVLLIALFLVWERYLERVRAREVEHGAAQRWWTPPPLMRPSLWTRAHGKLAAMFAIVFFEWCGFLAFTFWIQLYFQNYEGRSPILTMVRLLPMFVAGVLCNVVIAVFVGRVPLVILVVVGTTLTAVAGLLIAIIDPDAPYWAYGFPATIVSVFGADFVFATGTLFVAKVCEAHEQSVGGALFQTLTQLGTSFGLAISTIVFNATLVRASREQGVALDPAGTNAPRPAQLTAYHDACWTACAFAAAGAVLALLFLRGVGPVGHRAAQPPPPQPEDAEPAVEKKTELGA